VWPSGIHKPMAQVKSMLHIHSVFSTHIAELAFAVRSIQITISILQPSSKYQKLRISSTSTLSFIQHSPSSPRSSNEHQANPSRRPPKHHAIKQTMCGLMPSDSGYDLNLYPNLARYRTPQRDINDNTHSATNDNTYNDTNNNTYYPATDSDTYSYTAYGPCPINNPYQPPNQLNPLPQEEAQAQAQ
jgi:hypothetical protein